MKKEECLKEELLEDIINFIKTKEDIMPAVIQKEFALPYKDFCVIIDELERRNIISEYKPGEKRKVLKWEK